MQIDFHHGALYVLSRLAGFDKQEADKISHASQFVDDAVHSGTVLFKNRAAYEMYSSAHKIFDYRNFRELKNHQVWIPFHFLPGNELDEAYKDMATPYVQKLVCKPNSDVAQSMVKQCFTYRDRDCFLQLLGVVMHVYADTWSHQGFVGIDHHVNTVEEILDWDGNHHQEINLHIKNYFKRNPFQKMWDWIRSYFISEVGPVGHGAVLSYPDKPYLKWKYRDPAGRVIERNNPKDYAEASFFMFQVLSAMKEGVEPFSKNYEMNEADRKLITKLIVENNSDNEEHRHQVWIDEVKKGSFSFGSENFFYNKQIGQFQLDKSLAKRKGFKLIYEDIEYPDNFIMSQWKLVHDALKLHRRMILSEVLPEYDICAG